MRPFFKGSVWCCALAGVAALANPAPAAWNNVFQVSCFFRRPTTANYPPPAAVYSSPLVVAQAPPPCGCPQTVCTTNYVQRSYYQPVTSYQTQTYYEPVTTYRTSYYYEPVTSYRYSCYYDPCSCGYQQVAVPTTSYQVKSQCCPVQSWVQRCCQVPVTTYQKACYWEPVTTCCAVPPPPCPPPCPAPCPTPPCAAAHGEPPIAYPQQPPPGTQPPPGGPPGISEQRSLPPPPPSINEQKSGGMINKYYYGTPETGYRPRSLGIPDPVSPPSQVTPPPPIHLDRVVRDDDPRVEGQVVRNDSAPQAGARVMFVNADRQNSQQMVTANSSGRFQVSLGSGSWLVYITDPDGRQSFHSRIDVTQSQSQTPFLTLVSR